MPKKAFIVLLLMSLCLSLAIAQDNFIQVPAGTFTMGSPSSEPDRSSDETQHQVTLSAFSIGKYEITFDEYDAYCAATGTAKPRDQGWGRGNRPVINVSWYDAVNYCNWRSKQEGLSPAYTISGTNVSWNRAANGYRLPTEAEWEYAAKGGSQQQAQSVKYSGSDNVDSVAWYSGNSGNQSHPVGGKAPNGLGLYDMSGNVWEWCWDWYGTYTSGVQSDPQGATSGVSRVGRGGSWDYDVAYARSSIRTCNGPGYRIGNLGFRVVRP